MPAAARRIGLAYLNKLVSTALVPPIHPSVATGETTRHFESLSSAVHAPRIFSVNPDMSDSATESAAVAAFTNFVRLVIMLAAKTCPKMNAR